MRKGSEIYNIIQKLTCWEICKVSVNAVQIIDWALM